MRPWYSRSEKLKELNFPAKSADVVRYCQLRNNASRDFPFPLQIRAFKVVVA
jgi:hypothetical protein